MSVRWGVVDAESDPFAHGRFVETFLWGVYDGSTYRQFASRDAFITWAREQEMLLFAHNGGRFDYHFLLDQLPSAEAMYKDMPAVVGTDADGDPILGKQRVLLGFDLDGACPKIIHGRLAEFSIGKCRFRDSFNILPVPLSAYAKDAIDYSIFEAHKRDLPENRAKIEQYLKADCIYLYEIVKHWRDTYGDGLTLAGAAMKTWRNMVRERTGDDDFEAPQTHADFYKRMKPWYQGGRVECFAKGIHKKRFAVYDINSAYPYAMLHEHPTGDGNDYVISHPHPNTVKVRGSSLYHIRAVSDGAFARVNPKTGSLYFPRRAAGPLDFHVTGWEYLAAVETRTAEIEWIYEAIDFPKTVHFKEYVTHFYEKRKLAKSMVKSLEKAGDTESEEYRHWTAEDIVNKLLLNSLYGKFGADPSGYYQYTIIHAKYFRAFQAWRLGTLQVEWEQGKRNKDGDVMPSAKDAGKPRPERSDWQLHGEWPDGTGSRVIMRCPTPLQRYYHVATAASITGFVRAHLWKAVCAIRKAGGDVLYGDTDSLAVVMNGKPIPIAIGDALGQWKLEKQCDFAAIAGKKLYAFRDVRPPWELKKGEKEWKMAHKGVKLDPSQLAFIAQGGGNEVVYKPMAPTPSLTGHNLGQLRTHLEDWKQKSKSKKVVRKRKGSFVFTDRRVRMTV